MSDKVKILIVEDEVVIADHISMILEHLGYEPLRPVIDYDKAIESIERYEPDIAILDIQLKGHKDGIDLAWKIKEEYDFPFIFLTSNADGMTIERAKKVTPPAFLVKPFKKEDLFTSIELALHNYAQARDKAGESKENMIIKDAIFVKHQDLFHKVPLDDILYLKSDRVYMDVFTVQGKKHLIRGSLSDILDRLPSHFYRTHRSYIINAQKMDAINSAYVVIDKEKIPIGKNYRQDLLNKIQVE